MKITKFGPITAKSLIKNGGARLATYLKEDIFDASSVTYALALYGKIYKQIDDLFFGLNHANPNTSDKTALQMVMELRDHVNDFFDVMSRSDVCETMYRLDQSRGKNGLFHGRDFSSVESAFPYMMRFFDTIDNSDISHMSGKIGEIIDSTNRERHILDSLYSNDQVTDNKGYMRFRSHYQSKMRGAKPEQHYPKLDLTKLEVKPKPKPEKKKDEIVI